MSNALIDILEQKYGSQVGGGNNTSTATPAYNWTPTENSINGKLNAILQSKYGNTANSLTDQYNNTVAKVGGTSTNKNIGIDVPNAKIDIPKVPATSKKQTGYTAEQKKRHDELEKQLSELNNNAGNITTEQQADEAEKQRKAIVNELDAIDKEAGVNAQDYDARSRAGSIVGGWANKTASAYSNLGGVLNDLTLAINNASSEQDKLLLDSEYAGWATDDATATAIANATKKNGGQGKENIEKEKNALYSYADEKMAKSVEQTEKAKEGLGTVGKFMVDAAQTGLDLASDAAINAVTLGYGGMANMAARVFGQTTQQARLEGSDVGEAVAKGIVAASIEAITEKIGGPFEKIYGKTVAGKILTSPNSPVIKAISDFANKAGVKWFREAAEEGVEEWLSDTLNTLADHMFGWSEDGVTLKEDFLDPENREQRIYDAILGAFMGAVGASGNFVSTKISNNVANDTVATEDANNHADGKTNEPKNLETVINESGSGTKAASIIYSDPVLRQQYESAYGAIQGESRTEQINNIASTIHNTNRINTVENQTAESQATETAEQPTPQINPLTGAEHTMAQPVPTMTAEQSYMRGLIINMEVDEILSTPENIALYEKITGETLPRKADGTIDKKKADSQIIKTGRGTRSGETTISGNALNNNQQTNPVQTEQTATQETETQQAPVQGQAPPKTNPLNASAQAQAQQTQTQPVANPVNSQNTTQNATQRQNPLNTQATQENASNTAQNSTNDIPTQPINTEPVEVPITPQNANTKPTGSTDTAPTQDSIAEDTFTPEQYAATGGQTEHTVIHDADVEAEAVRRINENREQATADILEKDYYDAYDVGVSNMLINEAKQQLSAAITQEEIDNATKRLIELRKAREKVATKHGQALRQLGIFKKFSGSPADIISDASMQLYGEESTSSLSPAEKSNVFNMIQDFANKLGNLDTANTQETIDLIHEVSEARKTTGGMSAVDSKLVDKALHKIATMEGGQEFLHNLLTVQIRSIAGDYNSKGAINIGKAIRYLWALSNPKTSVTNVGANTVVGEVLSVYDNNMSLPFDALLSMFTGKREVAFDKGLFSKDTWQGASDALLKSMVEVALDAESDMANYAYNEIKGRTFKMSGNWMERFLSRLEMMQGFALKSTDQMAKGGIEAETKRGLNKLKPGNEVENAEIAKEEAKHRTLQNENAVSKGLTQVKNWLNKIHIGSEKIGTYGLGDHFIMFAQVPANQVVTQLELQPVVGTAISVYKICQMIKEGQNGGVTSKTQREAARALGKTATGATIIGLSMLMSATGCLRCVDEDDDDLAVMLKSMGKTGTQWNIDAFMRMVTGGDSKPQDGDTWISMNWVPQLNSLMIMGNALYRSKIDDGSISFSEAILAMKDGLVDSLADFPAVSGITSTVKSVKYAKYEGEDRSTMDEDELAEKDMEAKTGALLGNEVGNFVSGFVVPNAVRGIATGTDDTERDTYGTNNPLERAVNQVKSGIPGWRQTIAPRIDNFGNEVKNEGGIIQFLNKTLLPGALSHDRSTVPQTLAESIYNETGDKGVIPDRKAPSSISVTKNGEKETHYLTQEEKTAYQKRCGEICDTMYLDAVNNTKFAKLPADQQAEILKDIKAYAKGIATSEYKKSIGEDYENDAYYLTNGKSRNGYAMPALDERNIVDYFTNKNMLDTAMDTGDYATIDRIVRSYGEWNENLQEVFSARNSDINTYRKYEKSGIGSQTVDAYNKARSAIKAEEDTNSDGSRIKFKAIINADIPESEKEKLIAMEDNLSKNWKMVYDVLSDVGYSKQAVYDFFTNADWTLSQKSGEYEQNGQIGAYEAYAALKKENLTDEQRRYIFDAFAEATGEPGRYDNWSRNTDKNEWTKYTYDYVRSVASRYGMDSYTGQNKAKAKATATASAPTNTAPQNLLTILAEKYG